MDRYKRKDAPIYFDRFQVHSQIGEGSFGRIYKGVDLISNKLVAIKVENNDKSSSHAQLKTEAYIYKQMEGTPVSNMTRWPKIYKFGKQSGKNVLVMDILGSNFDSLMKKKTSNRLAPPAVLYIGHKMISLLQKFHKQGFVHRDLKPQNFVIEYSNTNYPTFPDIFLIDYGLAKSYIESDVHSEKQTHSAFSQKRSMKGTVRYLSINTHLGVDQSRRDDMQSLGYVLVYMMCGKLPWQSLMKNRPKNKANHLILLSKMKCSIEKLTSDIPEPFRETMMLYLSYANSLMYHEEPNYEYCCTLFEKHRTLFDGDILC
ncbi:kinase-like domain-containing protein [Blyttiomyces helicus]|uniref:non-specific serine/threonine protein kinase n=1 Tax=Blyttiomyces helicus TaxID=388810 RepID=A0A4P9WMG8_9FUNG|nr:kinase-like domain-containing protein [Blyttiomyces helicus]|eukprot:RKO94271.1 kinase-like domain-containing protein [Blyttiomyces helicus]